MRPKQLAKLCMCLLRHPNDTARALSFRGKTVSTGRLESLRRGADWLLRAQDAALDGRGYSRRYSLVSGWDHCYPETTGYIIRTLLDVGDYLGVAKYRDSALEAASWLLAVQDEEGSFRDIESQAPLVFDTGQVLLGLNCMFEETGDPRLLESLCRAAKWLVEMQEADGSWVRGAYRARPHAYYSRVGAALIEAGQVSDIEEFIEAGTRNLEWVAAQRQANGYFKHSEFKAGEDAILHTIVYVLEGFSMAFDRTGDRRWAQILVDGVGVLSNLAGEAGLLHSQYDPAWRATNREYCVSGLAQYAGICFDAAALTGDQNFATKGDRVLDELRRWQHDGGCNIGGALQSSIPLWGYYGAMEFFNWNVKFLLDALIKQARLENVTQGLQHP